MRSPLLAIARKEFIQIRRDKATIYMVFIFPLMMLILYGFGIRYDVKLVPMTILDQDRSSESRQYIERFSRSPYFNIVRNVENYAELQQDIDRGDSRIGVVIPSNFGERITSNREAAVQVIVDGSDNNTATISLGYFSSITRQYSSSIMMTQLEGLLRRTNLSVPPIEMEPRIWFNPDLKSVEFVVPGIIAIIMMIIGTVLTAVTIVKEKEQGTIEQIVASPIKRYELMIGKVIPYAVLAYLDFLLVVMASYLIFGIEVKGSLLTLLVVAFFYLWGVLGMGVLVSTTTDTQIAAMLTAILLSMLPSILLSGFIFPIRQMPYVLQVLTVIVPARYFIEILRDIYLKGLGIEAFWKEIIYIMIFGVAVLTLAAHRFRKTLDDGMFKRIRQIIRKEFIQIGRDSGLKRMVLIAPLLQLLIYGYVVATEIRSLPMMVLDQSPSAESRRLVERFVASGYFMIEGQAENLSQITTAIDQDRAMMGLVIPVDFAENVRRGTTASIQMLVDGSNSNTATIALGYAGGIVAAQNSDLMETNFRRRGFRLIEAGIQQEERVWFDPSLRAINYTVPGIICVLLMEMMVPLTAFSIVKEREKGTIEQLMVTPIHAAEMLAGKTVPYAMIGLFDAVLILAAGTFWFGVPVNGSVLALFGYTFLFIIVALGLGILIATLVTTQQQAALSAQFALIPNILLSGFMFPIESMPDVMQAFTRILPMRYFLVIVRGVMMKGLGFAQLWDESLALVVLGSIIFSISWYRFRKVFG